MSTGVASVACQRADLCKARVQQPEVWRQVWNDAALQTPVRVDDDLLLDQRMLFVRRHTTDVVAGRAKTTAAASSWGRRSRPRVMGGVVVVLGPARQPKTWANPKRRDDGGLGNETCATQDTWAAAASKSGRGAWLSPAQRSPGEPRDSRHAFVCEHNHVIDDECSTCRTRRSTMPGAACTTWSNAKAAPRRPPTATRHSFLSSRAAVRHRHNTGAALGPPTRCAFDVGLRLGRTATRYS